MFGLQMKRINVIHQIHSQAVKMGGGQIGEQKHATFLDTPSVLCSTWATLLSSYPPIIIHPKFLPKLYPPTPPPHPTLHML